MRGKLAELARRALQTAFRLVPWPTEPGLRVVGSPGPSSPVLVTGNYDLTVRRVLRALEGLDAWVVVAPSGGINVWCAAAGGHLGTHQVVSALKTSGIGERVRHRRAILPQLAATGVEARAVARRAGWHVRFGPVRAEDLPRYLADGGAKSEEMRRVRFGTRERLEMAAAWGAPASLVVGGGAALLHPGYALPLAALALGLAAAVFLLYDRLPEPRRGWFAALSLAGALGLTLLAGGSPSALLTAGLATGALVALLTFDYAGSTPVEGGSQFAERAWHIALDRERCCVVYSCWAVCPRACFEKPPAGSDRRVLLLHEDRCVRCGACVVQCPFDALAFADEHGSLVEPDRIRRFKLGLLGRRSVETPAAPPER